MTGGAQSEAESARTVNLDLGNAAEVNMVAINATHIAFVKLLGSMSSTQRRMEVHLANGSVIAMNFDEVAHAEATFHDVIDSLNHTIPDHSV
ncbi:MAG TPA: hypothetical protein VGZ52_11550 [Acidimicrobiales bacterium]|jgi:hypothetical protein|nr:hypothetical protein [Acidimicrobiales bacterium]